MARAIVRGPKPMEYAVALLLAESTYWCRECDEVYPLSNFYIRRTGKGAGKPIAPLCKKCFCADPDHIRVNARYGIDYAALWRDQEGCCKVCLVPQTDTMRVDHDHSCCPGKSNSCGECVRGLLCNKCNVAIAMFEDDPIRMREAAAYVEAWRKLSKRV